MQVAENNQQENLLDLQFYTSEKDIHNLFHYWLIKKKSNQIITSHFMLFWRHYRKQPPKTMYYSIICIIIKIYI